MIFPPLIIPAKRIGVHVYSAHMPRARARGLQACADGIAADAKRIGVTVRGLYHRPLRVVEAPVEVAEKPAVKPRQKTRRDPPGAGRRREWYNGVSCGAVH